MAFGLWSFLSGFDLFGIGVKNLGNKFHRKIIYAGLVVLIKFAQILPRRMLLRFAEFGGNAVYLFVKKERVKTLENLVRVFGQVKTRREIETIAKDVFVNLAKNLVDWIFLDKMGPDDLNRLVDIDGREKIEKALQRGKGVIVFTAHIGNWEYLAAYVAQWIRHGGVVARKIYYEKYDSLLVNLRKKHKVETVYSTDSPKKILRILKDNCVIGILPDQDVGYLSGVFVDFLGEKAYTPTGPAAIAAAGGAGLVPAFLIRQPDDRYKITVEDEIILSRTGDKKKDLLENTIKLNRITEKYVLKYPEQWVWMHHRWKTKETAGSK